MKSPQLSQHESEWVYSTILSRQLSPFNKYIHELPSVSLPAELFIGSCGYAFNPVIIPFWLSFIYALSYRGLSSIAIATSTEWGKWRSELAPFKPEHYGAAINTALYLTTVLITLAFTEIGKASFATTRPRVPTDGYNSKTWTRRYGKLVASLKSKHSFPSGDSAQAMNLCLFLWRHVPITIDTMPDEIPFKLLLLFGIFLPGVAFARVFYRCHWIEDCIGGILLSLVLNWALIPGMRTKIIYELTQLAP